MTQTAVSTLQREAQQVLDIQDACNLSGVVHAFSRAMDTLWAAAKAESQGTDYVNQHPIVTLYLSKLVSLNRTECYCGDSSRVFQTASAKVEAIATADQPATV